MASQPSSRRAPRSPTVSTPSATTVRPRRWPEGDDRGGHRGVLGHRQQVAHERAVDLHRRDRQAHEVAQRRVAGAEVVERDADPHRAQGPEDLGRVARVPHGRGLGDLQLERSAGRTRCRAGCAAPCSTSVCSCSCAGADVDAHAQRPAQLPVPGASLPARLLEDPGADGDQDAAVLGDGDEVQRRHHPALGVPPAHQRLHGDDLLGAGARRRAGTRGRTDRRRVRARSAASSARRPASSAFMLGWKNCQRSPPSSDARRMAVSALRSSSTAVTPSLG